jgi:hypothetical protein
MSCSGPSTMSSAEPRFSAEPLFRRYEPDELGSDGYPLAWHRLPLGWFAPGVVYTPGWGLKHIVRYQADYRCVRCAHPYAGGGEWSPCDERCTHAGPARELATVAASCHEVELADDPWAPLGVAALCAAGARIEARWRVLTVHHLDNDKANCRWWNLAALCQRCHLEIQGRVRMDRRWLHEHSLWFRPYVAGYYALVYGGEELSRAQVDERLDELLALEERQLDLLLGGT